MKHLYFILPLRTLTLLLLTAIALLWASTTASAQTLNWQLTQTLPDMDANYVPSFTYPVQYTGTFNTPQPYAAAIRRLNIDYRAKTVKEFFQHLVMKIKASNRVTYTKILSRPGPNKKVNTDN